MCLIRTIVEEYDTWGQRAITMIIPGDSGMLTQESCQGGDYVVEKLLIQDR